MQLLNNIKIFYQRYIVKVVCNMIKFNSNMAMSECVIVAKKHIENNIAKNSSGTNESMCGLQESQYKECFIEGA